uniref:Uncharacterized protein n=1 Tax=Oryza glumipatula TaxID=40148 RepID=A0A0D9ZKG8_9ORYZ
MEPRVWRFGARHVNERQNGTRVPGGLIPRYQGLIPRYQLDTQGIRYQSILGYQDTTEYSISLRVTSQRMEY